MKMQRAVKRSQLQEGNRSLIRHMVQESTFLNNEFEPSRQSGCLSEGLTPPYRRRFFSQSGPRLFATILAHTLHRFLAATHVSKRPSISGYSVRFDSQSGLPPSPATCNTFFRRLSLHALHAMHDLFQLELAILLSPVFPRVKEWNGLPVVPGDNIPCVRLSTL